MWHSSVAGVANIHQQSSPDTVSNKWVAEALNANKTVGIIREKT